jgi:hypothetical protein
MAKDEEARRQIKLIYDEFREKMAELRKEQNEIADECISELEKHALEKLRNELNLKSSEP